jgi:hypothetical protein
MLEIARRPAKKDLTAMADSIPAHLALARSQIGKYQDGPSILPLAAKIGELYPEMAGYCRLVVPTTSWCGLFCGHDLAVNGIRPPYNPKVDTQSFLWARAWLNYGTPVQRGQEQPGDILVFDFGGGDSHVTFHNGDSGSNYLCLGGNQSNQVSVSPYPKSQCIGIRRPPAPSSQPQPLPPTDDPAFRPMLQGGAMGPDVSKPQRLEVGPDTWNSLLGKTSLRAIESSGGTLAPSTIDQIVSLARNSALARHSWSHRGIAPIGYINGLAVTFARVYLKLKTGDSTALAMTAPLGGTSSDALAWYGAAAGDRSTTLRQLFALLYGLGMRESSGNCFEGRDRSASNVTADTAEAGLFQQSWNSRGASPELPKLFEAYSANPDGFLSIFREGLSGSASSNEGSGDGAAFQALCKSCPAFAVEAAAVGLRTIRRHWGPINRREAEIRPEAETLLLQVQKVIDSAPALVPGGGPIPTVPRPHDPPADLLGPKDLENRTTGMPAPEPSTGAPPIPHTDLARIE